MSGSITFFETKSQKFSMDFFSDIVNLNLCKPDCQRGIDDEQINEIIEFQKKYWEKNEEFFFPTPIIFGNLDGKLYIIDGQHRFTAIKHLLDLYKKNFKIPVVTLIFDTKEELEKHYIIINKNRPVPLPKNINDWTNFGRFVEDYIILNFRDFFSKSENPRVPNFNKDNLIKYINRNKISQQINNDYEAFVRCLRGLNDYYLQTYSITLKKYFRVDIHKIIQKSRLKNSKNPFILSIYKNFEWVDTVVFIINSGKNFKDIEHIPRDYRIKIKAKLKLEVWKKYFTKIEGQCFVCNNNIDYNNFHCGHIVSVNKGGPTCLSNLEPICSCCNINMGIKNLNDYKKELEDELN